jgi:phosphopantothenoylcysteine decarboxylase/phosphopantothenate--cysteine ligase
LWDEESPIPHTKLGQSADLVVVVPATARLIGAYAAGLSTDLLTNVLLATRAPVIVCPAMHTEMWDHPAVADNIATLRRRGVHIVEPDEGRLAGGDSGKGRLATPDRILAEIERVMGGGVLADVHVVVTAGGTREPIDAVRVISNRSSGKQGYAVAAEALALGATVTLVSTVDLPTPSGARLEAVETAAQMQASVEALASTADVIVMAAAVADFRPKVAETGKIKKDGGVPDIVLEPTPDILAALGQHKQRGQILVGFAAETNDLLANAQSKLVRKNLDLIVANDVSAPGVGFQHDTNEVTLLRRDGNVTTVGLTDKRSVARAILQCVAELRSGVSSTDPPRQPRSTDSGAAQ